MKSYSCSFELPLASSRVFESLKDVSFWWTGLFNETIEGDSTEFVFKAGEGAHISRQKLVDLEPSRKLHWKVVSSDLNFTADDEWQGTDIIFELSPSLTGGTFLRFTHEGLNPALSCYEVCSTAWGGYMDRLKKIPEGLWKG